MKILITGGAGYIGTVLTPLLLEQGHAVEIYDSLLYRTDPLFPFFRHKNFSFTKGDVREKTKLEDACKDKDVIIHLAAIVGFPACDKDPLVAVSTNVDGTKNLAASVSKDQYVLMGSTGSNYGDIGDQICTEESPLNPLTVYGKTKTEAEEVIMNSCTATAYRFATAFGVSPRMRVDLLINDLTYQAIRQKFIVIYEADFKRTFIHVHDIARSFLFAIENREAMTGEVYNVGDETMNYSKRQVATMVADKTGATAHFAEIGTDRDKRNYVVSYEKLQNQGFRTTITLEEGIDELLRIFSALHIPNPYSNV